MCSLPEGTWRFGSIFLFSGFAKKKCPVFGRVFKHHQAPGVEEIACKAFGKPPKIVPPEIAPHPDWDDFSVSRVVPGMNLSVNKENRKIDTSRIKQKQQNVNKSTVTYTWIH